MFVCGQLRCWSTAPWAWVAPPRWCWPTWWSTRTWPYRTPSRPWPRTGTSAPTPASWSSFDSWTKSCTARGEQRAACRAWRHRTGAHFMNRRPFIKQCLDNSLCPKLRPKLLHPKPRVVRCAVVATVFKRSDISVSSVCFVDTVSLYIWMYMKSYSLYFIGM